MYITLRELLPSDDPAAQSILSARPGYFDALLGRPQSAEHIALLRASLPEGADPSQKRLMAIESDGRLAGVLDAVVDYPQKGAVSVGLFLLDPVSVLHGQALPVAALLIERAIADGIDLVFAGCPAGWMPGERLLRGLGFRRARADSLPRNPVVVPDPSSRNRMWALEVVTH